MRIGIDLGGTKTEIICLHSGNGKELYRKRVPSPQNIYEDTLDNIVRLIGEAEKEMGQTGTVGIGIPGTVSGATGLVKNANSTWLNGCPLNQDLAARLNRLVRIENDANCLALSEATDGAGEGYNSVFAIIVGTGCGGGLVVDGKPISGLNGIGGEWGHNPLPLPKVFLPSEEIAAKHFNFFDHGDDPTQRISHIYRHKENISYFVHDSVLAEFPGHQCYCGKRGCIEKWISGPAFKADYFRVTGEDLSTHDIVAAAQTGEAKALAALDRYYDRFARSAAGVIDIFDPDIIVVGGGMSNVANLYEQVPRIWDKYIFSDRVDTKIVPARFGDSSGVRGAAWLWGRDA
ncbi:MAG: fructokinase [Alphaproteobacteria bacterium CG1_02_46_17]|nr:MAG: fructokinase [Alphaproteobacteria bacterium CG1_02_46_17]